MTPRTLFVRVAFAVSAIVAALGIAADVGLAQRQTTPAPVLRPRTPAEDLQLFSQVFNQIRVNHPDSVDSHRLFMAAIQAMVQATDPHSYVIQAVRLEAGKAEQWRQGRLFPVPIAFYFDGGSAVVASVSAGTAAARQDILPGDELTHIDGRPMQAESALELEVMLAGPRGSVVALTFDRLSTDGTWKPLERRVRRERVADETAVPASIMLDDTTGYVRITTFDEEKVAADLRSAVQRLERAGMRRLVLDLRGNGGGLVDQAATIAGEFLPTGAIVYTSEGRRQAAVDTGRVRRSFFSSERRYPMVVMIDDGSASASELVAGALQDHDRATIVGHPSFGKSLMMQGFPLSDGSLLVLVIGHVKTPCGRVVQRQYRGISYRNYRRLAGADRDTAGLPSCRTSAGRVVYGGGGIYPDVRLARRTPAPDWYRQMNELDLPTQWVGAYVTAQGAALGTLEQFARTPVLPTGAADAFRTFAAGRGVTVPRSEADDTRLETRLLSEIAYSKWGSAGVYQVIARIDLEVREAVRHFGAMENTRR